MSTLKEMITGSAVIPETAVFNQIMAKLAEQTVFSSALMGWRTSPKSNDGR